MVIEFHHHDDGDVKGATIREGNLIAEVDQQRNGGWLIQSNHSDFYEQRAQLPTAIGIAVSLIAGL